uniref:Uncharacterized protein n=1 Tax=Romanomermis culicivorax TaxID=13658 RepID=A0A915HGH5_ROMCU
MVTINRPRIVEAFCISVGLPGNPSAPFAPVSPSCPGLPSSPGMPSRPGECCSQSDASDAVPNQDPRPEPTEFTQKFLDSEHSTGGPVRPCGPGLPCGPGGQTLHFSSVALGGLSNRGTPCTMISTNTEHAMYFS